MRFAVMVALILCVVTTLILPMTSIASSEQPILIAFSSVVYSEEQFLKNISTWYPIFYSICPLCTKPVEEREMVLRQAAIKGQFDTSADMPLYEILLPNSATLASVQTWFGHPVDKIANGFIVRGWLKTGDAVLIPSFPDIKPWNIELGGM